MKFSAWLCIPVAIVLFLMVNLLVLTVASTNPVTKGFAPLAPLFGGFAALLVLLAGLKAGIDKGIRRKIYDDQTSIESIRELSWSQFELLIGEAYRREGYEVIETGGGGADGGIDLMLKSQLETVVVQCKQWKVYKVGVKPIRELYGVLMAQGADRAIFVTSGVYTQDAKDFARGKALELIDGDKLLEMIAPVRQQAVTQKLRAEVVDSPVSADAPQCPLCRRPMKLRTAKRGENVGSQFWGCTAYPKCRGTRQNS